MKALICTISLFLIFLTPAFGLAQGHEGEVAASDDIHCANCGMFPGRYPAFRSQAINAAGHAIHFCSTKCLVKYKTKHPGMKDPRVTVFLTGAMDSAETLWYVGGSSQMGPMGKEPLPFKSKEQAEAFAKEKGGMVVSFTTLLQHIKEGCPLEAKKDNAQQQH